VNNLTEPYWGYPRSAWRVEREQVARGTTMRTMSTLRRIAGQCPSPDTSQIPSCQDPNPMTYPNTQLFIAGQWLDAADGRSLAVFNPATGKEIGRVAHAAKADLDRALAAA